MQSIYNAPLAISSFFVLHFDYYCIIKLKLKMKKSVLITGCSRGGIGDALAQEFHKKGLKVFATARNLSKVEHLKTMGLEVLQLDVTSQESIRNAAEEVQKATDGKLDFLVNNAGSGESIIELSSSKPQFMLMPIIAYLRFHSPAPRCRPCCCTKII